MVINTIIYVNQYCIIRRGIHFSVSDNWTTGQPGYVAFVFLIKYTCSSRMNPPIKCFIFSKQILHTGKAYTASRKKRAPRVIRLLSRVLSSRTSRTYQPRAEALAQS